MKVEALADKLLLLIKANLKILGSLDEVKRKKLT